jgi:predicted phage terminase large subunit-like protein
MPAQLTAREVTLEQLARRIEHLAERAPYSLRAHAELIHRTDTGGALTPAAHHNEWVRVLEDRDTFPGVVVVAPPGYAKTTWFSQAFPAWEVGRRGGDVRIGLISNTASQAYQLSKGVQDLIEGERRWQLAYPNVRPNVRRGWRMSDWYVTGTPAGPNPTLLAAGINGPILGKRFDTIILDDPTTQKEARSETTMTDQKAWVKNTLLRRFPAGHGPPDWKGSERMVVVLTRWSVKDLVPTLVQDHDFKLVQMPALGYWDRTAECPNCERERYADLYALFHPCEHCGTSEPPRITIGRAPLWPEAESYEQLVAEEEADSIIFELVKQGNAEVLSGETFSGAQYQYGPLPPPSRFEQTVSFVDTAGGKDRKKGDYTAIANLGRVSESEVWVRSIRRDRLTAPEQLQAVKDHYELWKPEVVCVEAKNEGVALFQNLVAQTRIPCRMVEVTDDKEWRAIPLANGFEAGYIWLPDGAKWLTPFQAELEAFPEGDHDDMVDAVSGAYSELDKTSARVRVITG